MKTKLLLLFLWTNCVLSFSQIRLEGFRQADIDPRLYDGRWKAHWILVPNEPGNVYGIYHFRKKFHVTALPSKFIIHVSADNRYKLYVNGTFVSLGPTRGDLYNWNFETVDIAPYLREGENLLAAVVWNFAEEKPIAQITFNQTGFLVQGNTEAEEIVNTNASWKCEKNPAYSSRTKRVRGYYAAGAGEAIDSKAYLWGWEQNGYNDASWKDAQPGIAGAMKGGQDYPGRLLVPTPIPPMEMNIERLQAVRLSEGITCPKGFPSEKKSLEIPANSEVKLLLDHQRLTTGYLSLDFSKGKDAEIVVGYTEALYNDEHSIAKGNRNEIEGKIFTGYEDKIVADGGERRSITTLWWRTWRYISLTIRTQDEPLVLEDIYGTTSMYPFVREATFEAKGSGYLNDILDIGWHTARLCANETYMDCPYYEQLQYFGDTRIQAMITMYNTHDKYLVKNAIEQGRQSIVADGITMSRYPSGLHQFISSFSLWWICTGHDYWMYRDDEAYLETLLPAFRGVLSWYEQWLKPDYSLGFVPHWFFADWSAGFSYGEPIREKDGNSAFQDLQYLLVLDMMTKMEESFGIQGMAAHYRTIAQSIRSTFRQKYWNVSRGLFADTHDHRSYSQHVNALAVLAGIVTGEEAAQVMKRTLEDTTLAQATIYFRYYLHQALSKAGLGDMLLDRLQIWKDQMALGLTTWAEQPEPSRSDCHAWGSSPNIEFFRIVLGIDSDAPGFRKIKIAPALGNLKEVSGSMPHPNGFISANYRIDKKGKLTAILTLPENTEGRFIWQDKEYKLIPGEQTVRCE